MSSLISTLLDPAGLTPHGFCLAWEPWLIGLHVVSDLAIAAAYFSISLGLAWLARRRRDLAFGWMAWLFAGFILACGLTHLLAVVTLWQPAYVLEGVVKLITAGFSIVAAVKLIPLVPRVLALPSPALLGRLNEELAQQIVERDAALARLAEGEARYRAIYMHTPAPLHTLDRNGRIATVSEFWLDLLGYGRAEVLGRDIADFVMSEDRAAFEDDWDRLLARGQLRDQEIRLRRRDGSVVHVLASSRLERSPGGAGDARPTEYVLAVLVDVTGHRQMEAVLQDREAELRQAQKLQAIGRITGGIAHDFNNMLTAIDGTLDLIRRRVEAQDQLRDLVDSALQASAKAAELTAQLLGFARKQAPLPQPLDPVAVIGGMRSLLTRSAGERIRLVLQRQASGPLLCIADRNQLEAALFNLVLNARAAIADTGTITIRIGEATLEAEAGVAPGAYIALSVIDDGVGMTEAVQAHAFEPFFTTRQAGEGSGLGLAQIADFVHQSGGLVRLDSVPGKGTKVEILLPRATLAEAEGGMLAQAAQGLPPSGAGERVLVVEDEPAVLEIAVDTLRALGYEVRYANSAEPALALLQREPDIALLFTDIVMPGPMNGIELALEARRRNPALRVVFASGYSGNASLLQWPDRLYFMQKPYRLDKLARLIRECLDQACGPERVRA